MTQNQKPANSSQQKPGQGNATDPRQNEPTRPGQHQSNSDMPGNHGKKNPGHANPAHNTPGQTRQDQPGQQDQGQPGQDETQSYPGIKGSKARDLQQDNAMDKDQAKGVGYEAKAEIKETAGIATGNQTTGREVKAEKYLGAVPSKTRDAEDGIVDTPKE